MDVLKAIPITVFSLSLSSCYYLKSAYHQVGLLSSRIPIEKALQDPSLNETEKNKIRLAQEVMIFAEKDLGLKTGGNYSSFVKLQKPYVTYVVSAAPKWELKHHLWSFPFIGKVPYKGYFVEEDAKNEELELKNEDFDTYLRGVSAFSTLGWFRDPLLSSMLRYEEHDLINTLIHETVHATLYIKSNADFNERLAVYLGNWGTELYYLNKKNTEMIEKIRLENQDDDMFAKFISSEINDLEIWYKQNKSRDEKARSERLAEIQTRFKTQLKPQLKTKSYNNFSENPLNNARLLVYKTYLQDLSQFAKLAEKSADKDFKKILALVQTLEKHPEPEKGLKELLESNSPPSF